MSEPDQDFKNSSQISASKSSPLPESFWREIDELDSDAENAFSLAGGIVGLASLLFFITAAGSVYAYWSDLRGFGTFHDVMPHYLVIRMTLMTTVASLAVTCMFVARSALIRILVVGFFVAPSMILFQSEGGLFLGMDGRRDQYGIYALLFCTGACLIGFFWQLWLPWKLTSMQIADETSKDWGSRLLLELTAVAAAMFLLIQGSELQVNYDQQTFFAFGLGLSFGVLFVLYAFACLGKRIVNIFWLACGLAVGWCVSVAMLIPEFNSEFGPNNLSTHVYPITIYAAFGAGIIAMSMGLLLYWMRLCGWRCPGQKLAQIPATTA